MLLLRSSSRLLLDTKRKSLIKNHHLHSRNFTNSSHSSKSLSNSYSSFKHSPAHNNFHHHHHTSLFSVSSLSFCPIRFFAAPAKSKPASSSASTPQGGKKGRVLSKALAVVKSLSSSSQQLSQTPFVVHCQITPNNVILSLADPFGRVLFASSGGMMGYEGSRRKSALAAYESARDLSETARKVKISEVDLIIKGSGPKLAHVVKGIASTGLTIKTIQQKHTVAFNGCKKPKKRRM